MPEKRMFTKKITESDAFLDMPLSTQCLYFHLNMSADDDGFVNNPKRIMRLIGASEDDIKLLIAKAFVLIFDSGVIVIKHWRMHNTLQNDRYHPTDYQEEYSLLAQKDNKSYTWKQSGNILETELNITKHNITKHRLGEYKNVLLTDAELEKLKSEFPNDYQQRIERVSEYVASTGKTYKNYLATIRSWARKEKKDELPTYNQSKNKKMSQEEEDELLELMGKKRYDPSNNPKIPEEKKREILERMNQLREQS